MWFHPGSCTFFGTTVLHWEWTMRFRGFRIAVSFSMPKARVHLSFEVTSPFCQLNFGSSVLHTALNYFCKAQVPLSFCAIFARIPYIEPFAVVWSYCCPWDKKLLIPIFMAWGFLLHYSDLEFTLILLIPPPQLQGIDSISSSSLKTEGNFDVCGI